MSQVPMDSPFVKPQDDFWEHLEHLGTTRSYPAGFVLYRQGETSQHLYCLRSGRVRVSILRPDGSEKTLAIIEKSGTFGESAALDGLPSYATARSLTPSVISSFHQDVILAEMTRNPLLIREVLSVIIRKQRLLAMQVESMAFMRASARVALILARLATDYGVPIPGGGKRLGMRMTQEELASILGTSRVTVSRVIGDLLRKGILKKHKWNLFVMDEKRLWEMATDS